MNLRQFLRESKTFIFSCASWIKNNKYRTILYFLFLFLIIFAPWIAGLIEIWLLGIDSFRLLYLLILYAFLFIIFFIFLILIKKTVWLEKHQGFIVALGVLIPTILFFWQQSLERKDLFMRQATSLAEENNRNNDHLASVKTDLTNDRFVLFWRNFSTNSYKEYWSYIHLHYSQECKNLYADLTIRLDSLNNMIETRNNLVIEPGFIQIDIEHLNSEIIKAASNTQPILNEIIGRCQQN